MVEKSTLSYFEAIDAFDKETDELRVIIETPKGSRNKYAFDEKLKLFVLKGVLPLGASFPFDFGFIPQTLGGDGDPLDVLILMDEPAFTGCLVPSRLVGVIQAEQTERDGETARNDRLIAVAADSRNHSHVQTIDDLNETVIEEIEHFFISYNDVKGKRFVPLGNFGARKARQIVEEGLSAKRKKRKTKKS